MRLRAAPQAQQAWPLPVEGKNWTCRPAACYPPPPRLPALPCTHTQLVPGAGSQAMSLGSLDRCVQNPLWDTQVGPGLPPPQDSHLPALPTRPSPTRLPRCGRLARGPGGFLGCRFHPCSPSGQLDPPPGGSKPQTDAFSASNTMQCGSFPRHWAPHSQPHPAQDMTSGGIHSPASLTLRR